MSLQEVGEKKSVSFSKGTTWADVPEGATHYLEGDIVVFLRLIPGEKPQVVKAYTSKGNWSNWYATTVTEEKFKELQEELDRGRFSITEVSPP